MKKTIWSMLVAFGALSADTLTLRDGSRINGTMVSANSRNMSFTDARGIRRDYQITEVQQVSFGSGDVSDTATTRSRTETLAMPTSTTVDLVTRLNANVSKAMDRASLTDRQRNMLADARDVLNRATNESNATSDTGGLDKREIRTALDNIRYVMNSNSVRASDRRAVLDDIAQLREQYPRFR